MKKLTTRYVPRDLAIIIKIMEAGFEEAKPMTSIVIALHKQNYKIIKLTKENCIDYRESDVKVGISFGESTNEHPRPCQPYVCKRLPRLSR